MNRLTVSSVVLIVLHSFVISALANVKITPIAVENKSNLKSDLKVEEARYQNPIMPEYYGNSYDRNRPFVTSSYGSSMYGGAGSGYGGSGLGYGSSGLGYGNTASGYGGLGSTYGSGGSNYDRYGGYNSGSGLDRYGSNLDRYGSTYSKDRTGLNFGGNPIDKVNYIPGGVYNPSSGFGSGYGNSLGGYGNRNPYEGGSINGPYPGAGLGGNFGGMFPQDLESKKSLILPLAGAALLGIAAYTLVSNPGMAMGPMIGKRRKRSLFDKKLEQHLVYRAHQKQAKQNVK